MLSTIDLYQVKVKGVAVSSWTGLFIEMPDPKKIEEALRLDIAELDELDEDELDLAYSWGLLPEIISLYDSANGEDIRIADVLIGTITIEIIQGFGEVEPSTEIEAPMVHADFPLNGNLF